MTMPKPDDNAHAVSASDKVAPTLSPNDPKLSKHKRWQLRYDIVMLLVISVDLVIISIDLLLMSQFAIQLAEWLGFADAIEHYAETVHPVLKLVGGGFTIFLITELLLRWVFAVVHKKHLRWFFFPFVHWYEVLGCFPQLRALRLLRAVVIGLRLYRLGYQVLPQSWIDSGKFYYELVLEEVTDRVILTATDTIRKQLSGENAKQNLIDKTINKNRPAIEAMLTSLLQQELAPKLEHVAQSLFIKELSRQVGIAVQEAVAKTPELRRYLRLIPIAGKLIEAELQTIGQQIGENLVLTLSTQLTETANTEVLIGIITETITTINVHNPALEALIIGIIDDSLTAFEEQVKVQQWKNHDYLTQALD